MLKWKIIGQLINDNVSAEYRDDEYFIIQQVDENELVFGQQKIINKNQVVNGKIYWDGQPIPKTENFDDDIMIINGIKYKKV